MRPGRWLAGLVAVWPGCAAAQSCAASADPLSFGSYMPFSGAAADSTATVRVTCNSVVSLLVSYTLQLGGGGGGSVSARRMTGPGTSIPYQIYRDAARVQPWGDGTGGSLTVTDGYLLSVMTPVSRAYPAYGRMSVPAQAAPGSYSDTVLVLLTY